MGDRFYEDFETAVSSYSKQDDYDEEEEEEEETEGEYEDEQVNAVEIEKKSDELACPFCSEDFDVLGLCCHIDADHRMEVKPGICPICAAKVRINMASHVITQHESILKALCIKHRSPRSQSAILGLRKELQEKHLRSIKESPSADLSSDAVTDSMLLSFVNNRGPARKPQAVKVTSFTESSSGGKSASDDFAKRTQPSLTTNGDNERTQRCEFVQRLVLSTIFDDL